MSERNTIVGSRVRSPHVWGLLSATFVEPGYEHIVELVHQRDADARRHLESLTLSVHGPGGDLLNRVDVDVAEETLDLGTVIGPPAGAGDRVMVAFDARYDERIFPYRPHHYAYLRRLEATSPPLYYAISSALGGVPDRIAASRTNHFETYLFLPRPLTERYAIVVGNLARFAPADVLVSAYHGDRRTGRELTLPPGGHAEVPLAAAHEGRRLERVEVKAPFRLASYVTARRGDSGDLVLFDHLFTYFK